MTDLQSTIDSIRHQLSGRSEIEIGAEAYEVREVYDVSTWEERTNQLKGNDWTFIPGELAFAEDSNGNFFTIDSKGRVHFLDHETDERVHLAETLDEFGSKLKEPRDVDLPPHKVISVWVDPDFKPEFE